MPDSKGENTSGLFAKVLKFVRSPSTSWAGLETPEEAPESGYSKQMLKEMIERKRRNDFVRRREFDMLRKLRRSEVIAGHDPAGRPSFFQSSLPSRPDDRASTLKKIDEIEAQMSQQWWKTKNGEPTSGGLSTTGPNGLVTRTPGLASDVQVPGVDSSLSFDPGGASTRTSAAPTTMAATLPAPIAAPDSGRAWLGSGLGGISGFSNSGFSMSKSVAVDVEEFAHDPELEDVAIRFAHGDDAGAEAGLRALLAPGGGRQGHEETWLVLFDLYRAIGQQDRFDEAAVEFAGRFGRSAPQWLSLPELARGGLAMPALPAAPANRSTDWTCPAVLTVQGVQAMKSTLARVAAPWRLSWSRLQRIDHAAIEPFTRLLSQWASEPVRLRFLGTETLDALLRRQTVSGDRTQPAAAWQLRMEAARVMNRPDEFENVALDYCVTYEVSPPSWERPRCQFKDLDEDGGDMVLPSLPAEASGFAPSSVPGSGFGETSAPVSRLAPLLRGELAGSLQGDASAVLDRMPIAVAGEPLQISCARLVRVDFGAAGSLLNWCTARQAAGCLLQLTDVHRLIATFFTIVGISGAARITLRRD